MKTVFESKATLIQYYKITFQAYLTNFKLLLNCIEQRYTKGIESSDLVSTDFSKIKEFIGDYDAERLKHFFGDPLSPDSRDSQISAFDRFILDSVHFAVMNQLKRQLMNDYEANIELIRKAWEEELKNSQFTQDPIIFIPHYLTNHNSIFFQDLIFPQQEQLCPLFSFQHDTNTNENQLIIIHQAMNNWLEVSGPNYNLILGLALAGILFTTATVGISGALVLGMGGVLVAGLKMFFDHLKTNQESKTSDPNRFFSVKSEKESSELFKMPSWKS